MIANRVELALIILPTHINGSFIIYRHDHFPHQLLAYHRVAHTLGTLRHGAAFSANGVRHLNIGESRVEFDPWLLSLVVCMWIFGSNISRSHSLGRRKRDNLNFSSSPTLLWPTPLVTRGGGLAPVALPFFWRACALFVRATLISGFFRLGKKQYQYTYEFIKQNRS